MMSDWYKMNPVDWNDGTDDLTLEQEAAYLRICHAIYITERPIRENWFVIAGLLRCSDRKAKRLVSELIEAGKLVAEDGHIFNRRAMDEVSTRRGLSVDRSSAGRRGGIESGKSRSKLLKNNDSDEAIASSKTNQIRGDKIRDEEKREPPYPLSRARTANPVVILQSVVDPMAAQMFVGHLEEKRRPLTSQSAQMLVGTLREVLRLGGNPTDALQLAVRKGWQTVEIDYLRNAGFKFKTQPSPSNVDWVGRMDVWRKDGTWTHMWGPKPGERHCKVPPELLEETAA